METTSHTIEHARGLSRQEALERLERFGPNEVPEPKRHLLLLFARRFWGPSAWMLELIIVLAWVLGKRDEFYIASALLGINAIIGFFEEEHAARAVEALRQQLHVKARVLRDGAWRELPARELVPGDIIRLRIGDFVPADVQVTDGALEVDQSSLTGESAQVGKGPGETTYSGSIVHQGEATGAVISTGAKTFYGKTTQLVQSARPRLHMEDVVARVVRILFGLVAIVVAVTLSLGWVRGASILEALPLALVLLLGAVPVALPVMATVSMAVGSIELSRKGVLVARLNATEDAASMDVLCTDKTGTLTTNRLSLGHVLALNGHTEAEVLRDGALACETANRDPIDQAFVSAAEQRGLLRAPLQRLSFTPFSPQRRRTEAAVEVEGVRFRVLKGAWATLAELCAVPEEERARLEALVREQARNGYRALAVARADSGAPSLVGLAFLHDPPRPDSAALIRQLKELGISIKMLTGDAQPVAAEVARAVGLGAVVSATSLRAQLKNGNAPLNEADGLAEVLPEDKYQVVRSYEEAGHVVGMTGDGVNDAPSLKQAEVGIAVSGATDVARGAASVVLTKEGLTSIVDLVRQGRIVHQRILTWVVNKVSRTVLKTGLVGVAYVFTGRFIISAAAMMLLVFMTDFAKVALASDRARGSALPSRWDIGAWMRVAFVLGLAALAEALAVLAWAWWRWDLAHHPRQLRTFAFVLLLDFALLSLVSIREHGRFWQSAPSRILTAVLAADWAAGMAIVTVGLSSVVPLPWQETLLVFAWAGICCLIINDALKVFLIRAWIRPS